MTNEYCIRAEYFERKGIDTEIVCSGCDEFSGCVAISELKAIVELTPKLSL